MLIEKDPHKAEQVARTIQSVQSRLYEVEPQATCGLIDEILDEIGTQ